MFSLWQFRDNFKWKQYYYANSIIIWQNNGFIQMSHIWPALFVQVTWRSTDRKGFTLGQMKAGKSPSMRLTRPLPTLHCGSKTSQAVSKSQRQREANHFLSFYFVCKSDKTCLQILVSDHLDNYCHDDFVSRWFVHMSSSSVAQFTFLLHFDCV